MSDSNWKKVEFKDFLNDFGKELIIQNAPILLYTKKDKEHEAILSLIISLFLTGSLLIYISLSALFPLIFIGWLLTTVFIIIVIIVDIILIYNYLKSNIYIRPIECWFEIFEGITENSEKYYCFQYYPIFSGISHPNEAKNIIYKIFQEEVLKSTIDITQIEFYLNLDMKKKNVSNIIGYHFLYGEGNNFYNEHIDSSVWKFFPAQKSKADNYISVANWAHQYEWRYDLALDYDKLDKFAPWVVKRWSEDTLKYLNENNKNELNWEIRKISSIPKLIPWQDLESQSFQDPLIDKYLKTIH
ncbi:MAG: hypothetical protein P8Y70_20120 [Candidatus Lokiarchaeota archaeon]